MKFAPIPDTTETRVCPLCGGTVVVASAVPYVLSVGAFFVPSYTQSSLRWRVLASPSCSSDMTVDDRAEEAPRD